MYSQANAGKSFKGSVGVEVFQDRLRLPRQLFGGKQKYLALELPDTDLNRKMAEKLPTVDLEDAGSFAVPKATRSEIICSKTI